MFDNIGGKIKGVATIICVIGMIASLCVGFFFMREDIFLGIAIMIAGSLVSWLGSFFSYGFGQLIENSDIIAKTIKRENMKNENAEKIHQEIKKHNQTAKNKVLSDNVSDNDYINIPCPSCNEMLTCQKNDFIVNDVLVCPLCNAEFSTDRYK